MKYICLLHYSKRLPDLEELTEKERESKPERNATRRNVKCEEDEEEMEPKRRKISTHKIF